MNNIFEKLTHNMTQAIESSVSLALHNKNQEVEPLHFLWALLANSNSVLNQMLNKMNVDKAAMELDVRSLSEKLPKASNVSKENMKISKKFVASLESGVGLMTKNADSFLSVDTYIIANLQNEPFKEVLGKYLDLRELQKNLEASRAGAKIDSQTADENLEALSK
ncbi:MAG: Clp protease N-terminal domain-containing protein, partial [Thiovulaceae bacterium]|nr:Clp protease N-terminal domain-containing protein [Sulfurimonadaceae bacterium]